jgi:hypothetical protein
LRRCYRFATLALTFVAVAAPQPTPRNAMTSMQPAQPYRPELSAMQFVAPGIGWVIADHKLIWTEDNGKNWKRIFDSSDSGLVAAFFLDAKRGWVLLSYGPLENPDFKVGITDDAGAHWAVHNMNLPKHLEWLSSHHGVLWFVDREHGWLNLRFATNTNFDPGWLLRTIDGGKTWETANPKNEPGEYGRVQFLDRSVGWLTSGPYGSLFATGDGGTSWRPVKVEPDDMRVMYEDPTFFDDHHGILPVRYATENIGYLLMFETKDGGFRWSKAATIEDVCPSVPIFITTSGEVMIADGESTTCDFSATRNAEGTRLRLRQFRIPGQPGTPKTVILPNYVGRYPFPRDLTFVDASKGYMLTSKYLLSTNDGGTTWTDISPGPNVD